MGDGDGTVGAGDQAASGLWTIEELAAASGMTIRNVRAHQSRGLLPPPKVRGRVGYYGAEHLDRLRTIRQMQDEGFNLAAIASVLAAGNETADRLRRLRRPILEELNIGPRAELSAEGLRVLQRNNVIALDILIEVGVIRRLPDGAYAAATPALLAAGRRLRAMDVGWEQQLIALPMAVALAQQAAESVSSVADELCGEDCEEEVLDEARAWITEVIRAVLDRSISTHIEIRRESMTPATDT
jgi:DNA-binding transcriptional MerR regulator